jgi:hypothetical protein
MKTAVYHRGMIFSPDEAMYGSLKQVVPTTSCLCDKAILNLQTEEWPEAGFKRTGNTVTIAETPIKQIMKLG